MSEQEQPRKKRGPTQGHEQEYTKVGVVVGRNKTPVPRDEVFKLAALGCSIPEIANFFGVTEDAIMRNFRVELDAGRADQKMRLRQAMMDNACKNMNPAVQIFLAKNYLKMSDAGMIDDERRVLPWTDE
jgi:hypothetical protein